MTWTEVGLIGSWLILSAVYFARLRMLRARLAEADALIADFQNKAKALIADREEFDRQLKAAQALHAHLITREAELNDRAAQLAAGMVIPAGWETRRH